MEEVFLDIVGFEGLYSVSNLGKIYSYKKWKHCGRIMKQHIKKDGYCEIGLSKDKKRKTFSVHRIVAKAFIENGLNLPEVNHKNGNKSDNRVENLEWVTSSENQIHAIKNGLQKISDKHREVAKKTCKINGSKNKGKPNLALRKLTQDQALEIKFKHSIGMSMRSIAKLYSVDKGTISSIIKGIRYV